MLIKSLGAFVLICQLTQVAHSSNTKLLEMEASTIKTQLWSKKSFTEEDIVQSLIFVSNPDKVIEKYKNKEIFENLYIKSVEKIKDESFLTFSNYCKKIYESQQDINVKTISVHMLLERVYEDYLKDFNLRNKAIKFKEDEKNDQFEFNNSKTFDLFMNADKNVKVN